MCVFLCVVVASGSRQALAARLPSARNEEKSLEGKEKSLGDAGYFDLSEIRHFLARKHV